MQSTSTSRQSSRRSSKQPESSSRPSQIEQLCKKNESLKQELLTATHEKELMKLEQREELRRIKREKKDKIIKIEEERKEQELKREEERILREEKERRARVKYEIELKGIQRAKKVSEVQDLLLRINEEIEVSSQCSASSWSFRSHHESSKHVLIQGGDSIPSPGKNNYDGAIQTAQIAKMLADFINISRLPVSEPEVFVGDTLMFSGWKSSVSILLESKAIPSHERIYHLKRYLDGDAKEFVNSLFDLSDPHAYDKAMNLLGQRYESSFLIKEAHRDKLDNWLKLQPKDEISLRKYSDFLNQCLIAMDTVKGLGILNYCRENRKMLLKLPEYLILRWSRKITGLTDYSEFKIYVQYITEEADIRCNPITNFTYLDSRKKGMQSS